MNYHSFQLLTCLLMLACSSKQEGDSAIFRDKLKLSELGGEEISMIRFKDKVIILNLWATWCNPCIEEMPSLVKMSAQLPEKDFELILASDEELTRINSFIEKRGFDLYFVQSGLSPESLGAYSLPTTLIISKKGELIETIVGSRKWDDEEQIQKLLTYSNQ